MTDRAAQPPAGSAVPAAPRGVLAAAFASFIVVGWSGLIVPSYLLILQAEFARNDAEFGAVYLVSSITFAVGALGSGFAAERIDRRFVLPGAALALAAGLTMEGLAPTWVLFLVGAGVAGLGSGGIDAGVNGVVMDLSRTGQGGLLNRLHLFYSVGALAAPLAIGLLAATGIDWRVAFGATAVAWLALVLPLERVGRVPARSRPPGAPTSGPAADAGTEPAASGGGIGGAGLALRLALVGLMVAIAAYVAAEQGISSWLVGFLADQPMALATLALSGFWGALAAGRLAGSRLADRFDAARFTAVCALVGAGAVAAAVVGPTGFPRIILFMVAGFAFGPVYPMIMTVAGTLLPHRAAAVSGTLAAAAVIGSVTYPPLMGLISESFGLGAGMLGAALLAAVSGLTALAAGRAGRRHRAAIGAEQPAR